MASNGTWVPVENREGIQPIATTNAALPSQYQVGQSQYFGQVHPLGTIIRAYDVGATAYGEGEFIYLAGVSSTAVGSLVSYNTQSGTTTLTPNTASLNYPVAVAMSANLKTQYGWYQIAGNAVILKTAVKVTPTEKVALSGTSGRILGGSTIGKTLMNAISSNAATVASGVSTVTVLIQRPFLEPVNT